MGVRENDALGLAVEQNPIGVDAASSPDEGGAETNDMQTQEEIAVEAFRTAIDAMKKWIRLLHLDAFTKGMEAEA